MFNSELPGQAELPGTAKLISSTLLALVAAVILLVTVVLPAEYGFDPTGIGNRLGLTAMAHVRESGDLDVINNTPTADWRDDVTITIPGYGQAELKLSMQQGETAEFEWSAVGGAVAIDLHGDGAADRFISYRQSDSATDGQGTLTAEFTGTHGWYWQNQGKRSVEITLRTRGTYSDLKRVM